MSKKVVIAVGSFRKGSFNQSLANYIAEQLEANGVTAEFLDYKNVPMLEQDTEYPAPAAVEAVRAQVASANGLWVVSPEYNGSYPAMLKNVLDWLSRPVKPFDFETPTVINGLATTSSGAAGSTFAKFVLGNVQTLLGYIRTNVMPGEGVGIQMTPETWTTGELQLTDEQKVQLNEQVKNFIAFIG